MEDFIQDIGFLPAATAQHTTRAAMPHFIPIPLAHAHVRLRTTCKSRKLKG